VPAALKLDMQMRLRILCGLSLVACAHSPASTSTPQAATGSDDAALVARARAIHSPRLTRTR